MNEYLIMAREWWDGLQSRERLYLSCGGVAALLLLLWSFIWHPLASSVENLQAGVILKQDDLQWMQKTVKQIQAVQGTLPSDQRHQSLLGLLEERINMLGLKPALQRMNPDGANQVKFWLSSGNFNQLITLIGELEQKYGAKVISLSVTVTEQPGMVDARVTVVRGG